MSNLRPVFDRQQWSWMGAKKARSYGGLKGSVEVSRDKEYGELGEQVVVAVPTEFITYLRQVSKLDDLSTARIYCYYVDSVAEWRFGYMLDSGDFLDLWAYKELPSWLNPSKR